KKAFFSCMARSISPGWRKQLLGPLRGARISRPGLWVHGLHSQSLDRGMALSTLRRRAAEKVRRREFSRSKIFVRSRTPVDSFAADADSVRGAGTEMRLVA